MNIKINCKLSAYSRGVLPDLSKLVTDITSTQENIYYVRTYNEETHSGKWLNIESIIPELIKLKTNNINENISGLILNEVNNEYYELSIDQELLNQSDFITKSINELEENRIYYVIENLIPQLYINGGTAFSNGENEFVINSEYEIEYFGGEANTIDFDLQLTPLNSK